MYAWVIWLTSIGGDKKYKYGFKNVDKKWIKTKKMGKNNKFGWMR
ncbi:hypothetical protein [Anoxynatronum sibiricum]|uniref:NADH dehydrogenase subunit 3 n=1 Tax=Anoxynatronum sibiricum TaxID=210623 RepID=A0ABU9VYE3_9CLOT